MSNNDTTQSATETCVERLQKNIERLSRFQSEAEEQLQHLKDNKQLLEKALPLIDCKMNPKDRRANQNEIYYATGAMTQRIKFLQSLIVMHEDFAKEVLIDPTPQSVLHAIRLLTQSIKDNNDPYWQYDFGHPGGVGSLLRGISHNLEHASCIIERIFKGHFNKSS